MNIFLVFQLGTTNECWICDKRVYLVILNINLLGLTNGKNYFGFEEEEEDCEDCDCDDCEEEE
jgi:hypothetical protein